MTETIEETNEDTLVASILTGLLEKRGLGQFLCDLRLGFYAAIEEDKLPGLDDELMVIADDIDNLEVAFDTGTLLETFDATADYTGP